MKKTKPKNHHFVPKGYLKAWIKDGFKEQVWLYNKVEKTYKGVNIGNIFFIRKLNSIYYYEKILLNDEDKKEILSVLNDYEIFIDGCKFNNMEIFNHIKEFDKITLSRNGVRLKDEERKAILDRFKKNYSCRIEKKYDDNFENYWPNVVIFFECLRRFYLDGIALEATEIKQEQIYLHIKKLKEFILASLTRNPFEFRKTYYMESEEKQNVVENAIENEIKEVAYKSLQLDLLDDNRTLFDINNYDLYLIYGYSNQRFLTSDTPAFLSKCLIGEVETIVLFPVSPNILAMLSLKNGKQIPFEMTISDEAVYQINNIIIEKAFGEFISKEEDASLGFAKYK